MRTFLVLLFIAAPVLAGAAPADSGDLSLIPMTLKMLAALGVVVGLFLLLYALVQKSRTWLPGGSAHDSITVRAVRHLGPKRALYLVDVEGRRFFISAAGERISLLSQWEIADDSGEKGAAGDDAEGGTGISSFASLMQRQFSAPKKPASSVSEKRAADSKSVSAKTDENTAGIQHRRTTETQEGESCSDA